MSLVKSLSKARRTLPQMWLQLIEEIAKHPKDNDNCDAIITKELESQSIFWREQN